MQKKCRLQIREEEGLSMGTNESVDLIMEMSTAGDGIRDDIEKRSKAERKFCKKKKLFEH